MGSNLVSATIGTKSLESSCTYIVSGSLTFNLLGVLRSGPAKIAADLEFSLERGVPLYEYTSSPLLGQLFEWRRPLVSWRFTKVIGSM